MHQLSITPHEITYSIKQDIAKFGEVAKQAEMKEMRQSVSFL